MERQDWVELGDLVAGEHLWTEDGPVEILATQPLTSGESVYNLEIHGHHVYQVAEVGVLVHNICEGHHHFAPRAWGSNVPYGPKYLKKLNELEHTDVHRGLSDFLKNRTGHYFNALSGAEWRALIPDFRTRRALLIEFHKTFDKGKYWNDFVAEVKAARKAGYNPWG
ncbi:hypothetical protein SH501x_004618 [Pirellulaceae bacterium SH501]